MKLIDDKRLMERLALSAVPVGLAASCAYLLLGDTGRYVVEIVGLVVLAFATAVGARNNHIPRRFLLGLGSVCAFYVLAGTLIDRMSGTASVVAYGLADLAGKTVILTLLVGLVTVRRGRFTSGDVFDAVVISIGTWIFSWIFLVRPYLRRTDGDAMLTVVLDALYIPASVPIIACATILLFASHQQRASNRLISFALYCYVAGDLLYAVAAASGLGPSATLVGDAVYVTSFFAAAGALVHPTSSAIFVTHRRPRRTVSLQWRLLSTGIAAIAPAVVLVLVPVDDAVDRLVRAGSAFVLFALVAWRLFDATRTTLESQEQMLEMARTDDLTGLPNKSALLSRATDCIDDTWRSEKHPSLYLFDLDRFKNINDSLGHEIGDQILVVVAERLRSASGAYGAVVARPSGDEFLILDPSPCSAAQALVHAETLHSVFAPPVQTTAGPVFIAASVGVASMQTGRPLAADELFRHADIAMYRAKDAGRSCLALYDESMSEHITHRMRVETRLHGALDRREFKLFHQPIIDATTGSLNGFEALIRWQRDDGEVISPAEFIPIAEETGSIRSIGAWVLLEALTQLQDWISDGIVAPDTTMSVNVSPRQLEDPTYPDVVAEALQRSGIPPHLLWLEVTEGVMIDQPELARESLTKIRTLGPRIALDDFGTGYSSLSLLRDFPLQRIKIDRVFVDAITRSSNDRSLVRTIVGLGESMGLDVVAEGVETVDQLQMLRQLGCGNVQGFLISRPVPAQAMPSTVSALHALVDWPEFRQVLGDPSLATRRLTN